MEEKVCDYGCREKFRSIDEKHEDLKRFVEKLENRVTEGEKKVDNIDNSLSIKLAQIETKFDMFGKFTSDKIDSLGKELKEMNTKQEKVLEEFIKTVKTGSPDDFNKWLTSMGKKILEYGLLSGLLYGVGKGFKLF